MSKNIDDLILKSSKPSRYAGGEFNVATNFDSAASFCLCFPDVYEVAISNLGNKILYHLINETNGLSCERAYAPWIDFGEVLKKENCELFSLETKKPLKTFDMLGFSLSYEMCYTNVLYMLELSKIALLAKDRSESDPIVIGGGPCTVNPEPVADFFDLFVVGDGEDIIFDLLSLLNKKVEQKLSKAEFLLLASKMQGIYVPSLYETKETNGKIYPTGKKVVKAVVADLDKAYFPAKQIVPSIEAVHDRAVIELFRGCTRGCRFCQACFIYRPIRAKSVDNLYNCALNTISCTGFDELSLTSLSTGDYPSLNALIEKLEDVAKEKNVNLSLPSLRLDSFKESMTTSLRKSSLTFAPEAATQRLRDVVNKNISEQEFDLAMENAFKSGYNSVKLYFMIGLPTETEDDVRAIFTMANRVKWLYKKAVGRKDVRINVSVANFVPKPFTPFQWEKQDSIEEFDTKHKILRELFYKSGLGFSYHDSFVSKLEGALAVGGREMAKVIASAFDKGAIYDGWSEHFKRDVWENALTVNNIELNSHTNGYGYDDILPWNVIDVGVSSEFLIEESKKAKNEVTTADCGTTCNNCGVLSLNVGCKKCW